MKFVFHALTLAALGLGAVATGVRASETMWSVSHLVEPTEPWDKNYAHKPWVLKHDGVVYHFYCAVGNEGRVIGLATSKDLHQEKTKQ